jgi:hypothetical protein
MSSNINYTRQQVKDYAMTNKESAERVAEFLKVNCLDSLDDCDNLYALETLLAIEKMMLVKDEPVFDRSFWQHIVEKVDKTSAQVSAIEKKLENLADYLGQFVLEGVSE